jgi:putative nucleotidyltransferase with HDIG domain
MSTKPDTGITRDAALNLLREHLKNDRLIDHCKASEVIMRKLAEQFGEDVDLWGLAGLLHDLDYEMVSEDPARHGAVAADILTQKGVNSKIVNAIRMHNAEGLGLERSALMEHALTCAETITGLIVATALVYPDKKIASVKPSSVTKRMKTAHFARAVNRERIMECEKIGLQLNAFVTLSLEAMSRIADELGL